MPPTWRFPARGLIRAALAAVAGAAAVPACMFLSQERLIFMPQPLAAGQPRGARIEEVELDAADGTRLHGWFASASARDAPAPLLIYFGGNAEEVSWMLPEGQLRLPGWSLLMVNYRGYGRSQGRPGERALFADALALYDYAVSRPDVDPRRVAVMGRSLGSGVAVHLAAERPLAAVVLVTPFDSVTAVAQALYPFLPVDLLLRHRFDSVSRAPEVRVPLLTVAASRDQVIPPRHAARLYEAWAGPKQWRELAGAGHNDVSAHPEFWPGIDAFLAQAAAGAADRMGL
jgi:hypothetical protein